MSIPPADVLTASISGTARSTMVTAPALLLASTRRLATVASMLPAEVWSTTSPATSVSVMAPARVSAVSPAVSPSASMAPAPDSAVTGTPAGTSRTCLAEHLMVRIVGLHLLATRRTPRSADVVTSGRRPRLHSRVVVSVTSSALVARSEVAPASASISMAVIASSKVSTWRSVLRERSPASVTAAAAASSTTATVRIADEGFLPAPVGAGRGGACREAVMVLFPVPWSGGGDGGEDDEVDRGVGDHRPPQTPGGQHRPAQQQAEEGGRDDALDP